jgi:hypothetical protein
MMVSIWWAVWMFFLGACAGTLMFALMSMTAREREEGVKEEQAFERDVVSGLKSDEEWTGLKLDEEWTALTGSPSKRVGEIEAGKKRRREVEQA